MFRFIKFGDKEREYLLRNGWETAEDPEGGNAVLWVFPGSPDCPGLPGCFEDVEALQFQEWRDGRVFVAEVQAEEKEKFRREIADFLKNPGAEKYAPVREAFARHLAGSESGRKLLQEAEEGSGG